MKKESGVDVLDKLMKECYEFANGFFEENFSNSLYDHNWWVNIGGNSAYHNPHVHGRTTMIGIYFIEAPDGSGDLAISRNDGTCYTNTYNNHPWGKTFYITPEVNRFYILPGHLWHWVDHHTGAEERISISINYD
jgi:uncharacterized protein (TIGR02466 family)